MFKARVVEKDEETGRTEASVQEQRLEAEEAMESAEVADMAEQLLAKLGGPA